MSFDYWRQRWRAWLFAGLGRDEAAREAYALAFARRPGVGIARQLGSLCADAGELRQACQWFEVALRFDATDADTWFNLGFANERTGSAGAAIAAFREAIRLDPAIDRAWFGLGLAHTAVGEHAQAADAFREASHLQPLNAEAAHQLGLSCHRAGQPEQVRAAIARLRTFDPARANVLIGEIGDPGLTDLISELPF